VAETLDPATAPAEKRHASFQTLARRFGTSRDPLHAAMARTMVSFAPGLFAGGDDPDLPRDNLELERFFRLPKSHERRIHGHRHAEIRIVAQGPTLLPALDAHANHPKPFSREDLWPYADAPIPVGQAEACRRRKIMRKARSTRARPSFLRQLEKRYLDSS